MKVMNRSLYDELGVPRNASFDDVKKAYKKLALQNHPDKVDVREKSSAEARFNKISEAYAVLSDENRRRLYDHTGITDEAQVPAPTHDIHEFMRHMFGRGFPGRDPHGVPVGTPGIDLFTVKVSPSDVFRGLKNMLGVLVNVECPDCCGKGVKDPASDIVYCPMCQGSGMMTQRHGPMEFRTMCPACKGTCKIISPGKGCARCGSSGCVQQREEFVVELSPGFKNDTEFVIKGKGNKLKEANARNDLKIVAEMQWPSDLQIVHPSLKELRIVDNDTGAVHARVEVGLLDVLEGREESPVDLYGTGEMETHVALIQFPEGYRDPTRPLVLKGQGLPRNTRGTLERGNLVISYTIVFPPDGSNEANKLKSFTELKISEK